MVGARRASLAALACALVAALPGTSFASEDRSSRVVILHPVLGGEDGDSLTAEAVARMTGELLAAGFTVMAVDVDPARELRTQIEAVSSETRSLATFAIERDIGAGMVDVWFSNTRVQKTRVQRIDVSHEPPARAPGVLAVRAAEVLRGFLEELPTPSKGPPLARDKVTSQALAAVAPEALRPHRGALGVLVGAFTDATDPAPALCLGALGQWSPIERVDLIAALTLGATTIENDAGEMTLQRGLGTIGAQTRFFRDRSLQPFVGAALGVHHLRGEGETSQLGMGNTRSLWSFAAGAGAGLAWRLSELELRAEIQAQWLTPRPLINVGDVTVARAGRPTLLAALTTSWRFGR
jgi:hypothetical protein